MNLVRGLRSGALQITLRTQVQRALQVGQEGAEGVQNIGTLDARRVLVYGLLEMLFVRLEVHHYLVKHHRCASDNVVASAGGDCDVAVGL